MSKTISLKVTLEQNAYLEAEASNNKMTKSEYIKARIFEDQFDSSKITSIALSEFEKDLISSAKKAMNFSYLVASKVASAKEIKEASQAADNLLINKGYKNKNANSQ